MSPRTKRRLYDRSPQVFMMWARFKAMLRADTRMFEMYSAVAKLTWAGLFCTLNSFITTSSFERVDDFVSPYVTAAILIPWALGHIFAILVECGLLRRMCIMAAVIWWSTLAFLMFQYPPNIPAGVVYAQLALFNIWAFVAARLRGEVKR